MTTPTRLPSTTELESALEAFFVKRIREMGGLTYKLAPTVRGIPDRLVLLGGRMYLVELKAHGGRLSPIQTIQHARIREQGVHVDVLTGRVEVNAWINRMFKQADAARDDISTKRRAAANARWHSKRPGTVTVDSNGVEL